MHGLIKIGQFATAVLGRTGLGQTGLGRWLFQRYYALLPRGERWVEVGRQRMWLDLSDRTQLSIALGSHEKAALARFLGLLRPGQTVVDVGANVGLYTLAAARAVGPGGRVVAFEPEPRNCARLQRNVEANGHANVTVVQAAVGEASGRARLYLGGDSGVHSLLAERAGGPAVEVEVVALDEYCEREGLVPDVVKVDAEGAELAVLRGLRRTLRRAGGIAVVCELYDPDPAVVAAKRAQAEALLAEAGLRVEGALAYRASTLLYAYKPAQAVAQPENRLKGYSLVSWLLEPYARALSAWEGVAYVQVPL